MSIITTTLGPMEDSALIRHDGVVDNENEHTTSVEYCLADCDSEAHTTGIAQAESYFCHKHIHRSAHVTLKKMPGMGAVAGGVGG